MLVYLYYPLLILLLFWGSKIEKWGEYNEEFLSLKQTKALQGFTAILIMLHHISQKTCAFWLDKKYIVHGLDIFVRYGYYFVGIFLFCSGYGLLKSFQSKDNYFKGYFRKRVLPLVLAYYLIGYIFLIVRLLMKQKMIGNDLLFYTIGYRMPNPNSWYVIAAPFFYLVFYLCFRFMKNKDVALVGTCLGVFAYTILGTYIRHNDFLMCGEWWYNSVHMFSVGLIFARFEKQILSMWKKYYKILFVVGFVLIFVTDHYARWAEDVFSYYYGEYSYKPVPIFQMVWRKWVTLLFQQIASTVFVLWVFLASMKVKIGNKALEFMGKITLEFYLIHGLFVELFGFDFMKIVPSIYYIRNVALFVMVVFACALPCAILIHKIINLICQKKNSVAG